MSGIIKEKGLTISKLINHDFKCKICNREFTGGTYLINHLKTHNIEIKNYLLKYYDIDINKINKEWEKGSEERKIKKYAGLKKCAEENKGIPFKERLGEKRYQEFMKSMNGVFTKDWYIFKYGNEEGLDKYKERSKKLSKNSYWNTYNKENHQNWSKISQELFWEIYNRINKTMVYFGELNHEFSCGIRSTNFDFVVVDNNKIIEFNGDKFHANPKLYKKDDIPLKFIGTSAKEIWEYDKSKNRKAKDKGYDIKIVWESDYIKNKEKIILECIDFINEYENS
jgi:hypothetical protein